jgi:hypothetical protein
VPSLQLIIALNVKTFFASYLALFSAICQVILTDVAPTCTRLFSVQHDAFFMVTFYFFIFTSINTSVAYTDIDAIGNVTGTILTGCILWAFP